MLDKIKIPCTTENLKEVRKFINDNLSKYSIHENELNMITLAVDEICANRIIHSNKSNRDNQLEVEILNNNEGLVFKIKDKGEYYDNTSQVDPEILNLIKDKRKGGIGLMLARKIMDSIEVKKEDPYTTYTLIKKLKLAQV